MRVLVTGATGLVGRRLCKEILRKGYELVVIGRSSEEKFRSTFTLPCEYQNWNSLKLTKIYAVFHLAGESIAGGRWSVKKKESILKSRTHTVEKLVRAFNGSWPEVFVGASAIGYYGNCQDSTVDEEDVLGRGYLAEVCKKWEDAYEPFEHQSRVVRIRIGLVLDPDGGFLGAMERLFSMGLGGKVSHGRQWMSWIHAEDLVRILLFVAENPIKGIFNAVAPKPITNLQWTKIYSSQLKVNAFLPVPGLILKAVLGEMSQLALYGQKVSSNKIILEGFEFNFGNMEMALGDLYRWQSRPTERFFKSEQWIEAKRDKIFPFFSDAKNLEKITPPWLKIKVLGQSDTDITTGTVIDYKITVKGIPTRWKTKIENWSPPEGFVDDQLKGPYKRWYHTHFFEDFPSGTLMTDYVVYELPLGFIGQLIAGEFIKRDISKIFSYRSRVIGKLKI